MFRIFRFACLALVLAVLVTSTAYAAPRAGRTAASHTSGIGAVWEWAISTFAPVPPVSKLPGGGIMEKEGSSMDPNGKSSLDTLLWNLAAGAGRFVGLDGF